MTSTSTDGLMYKIDHSHHFHAIVSSLHHLENSTRNIKAKLKPDRLTFDICLIVLLYFGLT